MLIQNNKLPAPTAALEKNPPVAQDASALKPSSQCSTPDEAPDPVQLAQAIERVNRGLQVRTPNLEFMIDSDSGRTIVKVVDRETSEVIRQMPSREALQIAEAIDRMLSLQVKLRA